VRPGTAGGREKSRAGVPELVTRGPDGKIENGNYLTLTSMLPQLSCRRQNSERRPTGPADSALTNGARNKPPKTVILSPRCHSSEAMFEQAVATDGSPA